MCSHGSIIPGSDVFEGQSGYQMSLSHKRYSVPLTNQNAPGILSLMLDAFKELVGGLSLMMRNDIFIDQQCATLPRFSGNASGLFVSGRKMTAGKLHSTASKSIQTNMVDWGRLMQYTYIKRMMISWPTVITGPHMIVRAGKTPTFNSSSETTMVGDDVYVAAGPRETHRISIMSKTTGTCTFLQQIGVDCGTILPIYENRTNCPFRPTELVESDFLHYSTVDLPKVVAPYRNYTVNVTNFNFRQKRFIRSRQKRLIRKLMMKKGHVYSHGHTLESKKAWVIFQLASKNFSFEDRQFFNTHYQMTLSKSRVVRASGYGSIDSRFCTWPILGGLGSLFGGGAASCRDGPSSEQFKQLEDTVTNNFELTQKITKANSDALHTINSSLHEVRKLESKNFDLIEAGITNFKTFKNTTQEFMEKSNRRYDNLISDVKSYKRQVKSTFNYVEQQQEGIVSTIEINELKNQFRSLLSQFFSKMMVDITNAKKGDLVEMFGVYSSQGGHTLSIDLFVFRKIRFGKKLGVTIECEHTRKCMPKINAARHSAGLCVFNGSLVTYCDEYYQTGDRYVCSSKNTLTYNKAIFTPCEPLFKAGKWSVPRATKLISEVSGQIVQMSSHSLFTPLCGHELKHKSDFCRNFGTIDEHTIMYPDYVSRFIYNTHFTDPISNFALRDVPIRDSHLNITHLESEQDDAFKKLKEKEHGVIKAREKSNNHLDVLDQSLKQYLTAEDKDRATLANNTKKINAIGTGYISDGSVKVGGFSLPHLGSVLGGFNPLKDKVDNTHAISIAGVVMGTLGFLMGLGSLIMHCVPASALLMCGTGFDPSSDYATLGIIGSMVYIIGSTIAIEFMMSKDAVIFRNSVKTGTTAIITASAMSIEVNKRLRSANGATSLKETCTAHEGLINVFTLVVIINMVLSSIRALGNMMGNSTTDIKEYYNTAIRTVVHNSFINEADGARYSTDKPNPWAGLGMSIYMQLMYDTPLKWYFIEFCVWAYTVPFNDLIVYVLMSTVIRISYRYKGIIPIKRPKASDLLKFMQYSILLFAIFHGACTMPKAKGQVTLTDMIMDESVAYRPQTVNVVNYWDLPSYRKSRTSWGWMCRGCVPRDGCSCYRLTGQWMASCTPRHHCGNRDHLMILCNNHAKFWVLKEAVWVNLCKATILKRLHEYIAQGYIAGVKGTPCDQIRIGNPEAVESGLILQEIRYCGEYPKYSGVSKEDVLIKGRGKRSSLHRYILKIGLLAPKNRKLSGYSRQWDVGMPDCVNKRVGHYMSMSSLTKFCRKFADGMGVVVHPYDFPNKIPVCFFNSTNCAPSKICRSYADVTLHPIVFSPEIRLKPVQDLKCQKSILRMCSSREKRDANDSFIPDLEPSRAKRDSQNYSEPSMNTTWTPFKGPDILGYSVVTSAFKYFQWTKNNIYLPYDMITGLPFMTTYEQGLYHVVFKNTIYFVCVVCIGERGNYYVETDGSVTFYDRPQHTCVNPLRRLVVTGLKDTFSQVYKIDADKYRKNCPPFIKRSFLNYQRYFNTTFVTANEHVSNYHNVNFEEERYELKVMLSSNTKIISQKTLSNFGYNLYTTWHYGSKIKQVSSYRPKRSYIKQVVDLRHNSYSYDGINCFTLGDDVRGDVRLLAKLSLCGSFSVEDCGFGLKENNLNPYGQWTTLCTSYYVKCYDNSICVNSTTDSNNTIDLPYLKPELVVESKFKCKPVQFLRKEWKENKVVEEKSDIWYPDPVDAVKEKKKKIKPPTTSGANPTESMLAMIADIFAEYIGIQKSIRKARSLYTKKCDYKEGNWRCESSKQLLQQIDDDENAWDDTLLYVINTTLLAVPKNNAISKTGILLTLFNTVFGFNTRRPSTTEDPCLLEGCTTATIGTMLSQAPKVEVKFHTKHADIFSVTTMCLVIFLFFVVVIFIPAILFCNYTSTKKVLTSVMAAGNDGKYNITGVPDQELGDRLFVTARLTVNVNKDSKLKKECIEIHIAVVDGMIDISPDCGICEIGDKCFFKLPPGKYKSEALSTKQYVRCIPDCLWKGNDDYALFFLKPEIKCRFVNVVQGHFWVGGTEVGKMNLKCSLNVEVTESQILSNAGIKNKLLTGKENAAIVTTSQSTYDEPSN